MTPQVEEMLGPGVVMLMAALEDNIHSLMRDKLALQTDLELLRAGLATAVSSQQQQLGGGSSATNLQDPTANNSRALAVAAAGDGLAGGFIELQGLVQHLQQENAAVKASLAELLAADDQEFARLHALLADKTVSQLNLLAGSSFNSLMPGQDDDSKAAAVAAADLQLFDLRGVDHTDAVPDAGAAAEISPATIGQRAVVLESTPGPQLIDAECGSSSTKHALLALIQQQQLMLVQMLSVCNHHPQQQQQGDDAGSGPGITCLLQTARQQAQALSCTLTDIRHAVATEAANPAALISTPDAAGPSKQNAQHKQQLQQPQQQQQQQQQQPRREELDHSRAADAAAAARHSPAAGGEPTTAATAEKPSAAVDTIDLRHLQQQQQQQQPAAADSDSDDLDALLHDAEQLLPAAAVQIDAAGHLLTPAAASTAAAALAAVQRQHLASTQGNGSSQQQCCALCGEQFPSAAAFWAHCVMPHHVLLLLVRRQQLKGTGLLGMPAAPGWWRRPLLLPSDTAAAAAGSGDDVVAAAVARCCGQQLTEEIQLVEHCLTSWHLDKLAAAAADQAGSSSSSSRFTPDCCEYIRQLTSSLITTLNAATLFVKLSQSALHGTAAAGAGSKRRCMSQHQAGMLNELVDKFTSASSAYLDGFNSLQASGLLPVPVPQGAAQALGLLLDCHRHQVVTYIAENAEGQQSPAQLPDPGPAMRVWMSPGVYVLPIELLLLLEHEPAAAAAASVMLGIPQAHAEQQDQQQQQQDQQHQPRDKPQRKQQQERQAEVQQVQKQTKQQQKQAAKQTANSSGKAGRKQQQSSAAAPAAVDAADSSTPSTRSQKRLQEQQSTGDAAAAAKAAGARTAAADGSEVAGQKTTKRRKHEPIPKPPAVQLPAAAASGRDGSAVPSPSTAGGNGTPGKRSKRSNSSGSGFVQLGNRIATPAPAAQPGSPRPHLQQQQQQHGIDHGTRGSSLPPPMLNHGGSGDLGPPGGFLEPGELPPSGLEFHQPPPLQAPELMAVRAGWGLQRQPLLQYDDLYEEQAVGADVYPSGHMATPYNGFGMGDHYPGPGAYPHGMQQHHQRGRGGRRGPGRWGFNLGGRGPPLGGYHQQG